MKALIYGNLTLDNNITEKGFHYKGPGGASFYVGQFLRNFNYPFAVVSSYGENFPQKYIKRLNIYPPNPTGKFTLTFKNEKIGGKRFQKAEYLENSQNVPVISLPEDIFTGVDILFLSTIIDNLTPTDIRMLKAKIGKKLLRSLIIQGLFRGIDKNGEVYIKDKNIDEYLELVDLVFLSEDDTAGARQKALNWSLKGPLIVITKAEKGCSLYKKGREYNFPKKIFAPIIDSTGAGDIFAASFTFAKKIGKSDADAAVFANNTAAYSLSFHADQLNFSKSAIEKL